MGLFRRADGSGDGARYRLHQKLLSVGDDYWIEDESGQRVFRVDGKALRLRKTFVLETPDGAEVAKIQERKLSVRDKMVIERPGRPSATVKKALFGLRDRFSIDVGDGNELKAKGDLFDHEYDITRDGDTVVTVSKRWFTPRDSYGIEIAPGEDDALMLAVVVCIDALAHDEDHDRDNDDND